MKAVVAIVAVLILGGMILAFTSSRDSGGEATGGENSEIDRLSNIAFTELDGTSVSLSDHKGTPLVINSWATWCPFCREELPDFAELQVEYGDEIVVIAIDRGESVEKVTEYLDSINLRSGLEYWQDDRDNFYKQIGGFTMPETLFIDNTGEIVVHKRGFMDLNEMREHTEKIISN